MKLNDINIKKAKPGDKARKLFDGGGLYLEIAPTGGKLWRFKYRLNGKEKRLAMGKYPDVSLHEARKRHMEAREQLAKGIDPAAAKQAQKVAGAERSANSFEVIAREWFDRWKCDKVAGTIQRAHSILEKETFPYIGKKLISEIKTPDVLAVLRRIEERALIVKAHKAKDVISLVFRHAVQTGRAEYNPCDNLRGALQSIKTKHFAAFIEPVKVAELLRAIDAYTGGVVIRAALRIAPMVFTRPGELRTMKWKDIDFENKEWSYTVSKTKTAHIVPLASQVVAILKDLHPLTGDGEYVFPGVRPGRPFSNMTINRALQSMGYDTKTEMTGHGFRAMARTMLAERLRVPEAVAEKQLSHCEYSADDSNKGAYDRTKFIDERRKMMQTWADYLDQLKQVS